MDRENRVRAWRPSVPGVAEVLHAQWRDHVHPRHTHDTWTLLLVDDGLIGDGRAPDSIRKRACDLLSSRHRKGAGSTVVDMSAPIDPPCGTELFDTPEEAALAGWRTTPSAHPRVIAVEPSTQFDGLWVTIRTDGHPGFHDRDITNCQQTSDGRWFAGGSAGA